MPELPEVQTVADYIKPDLIGKNILKIEPLWKKVLHNFNPKDLNGKHRIQNVSRRAKFIIIELDNIILAIPSNGIHSTGFSLVRSLLKKNKIPNNLKEELLKPTKIYSKEILKLTDKNLINAAAHITGGGLVENLNRSLPKNLSLHLDLAKIKIPTVFKWLKSKNISDQEMMRTFNCGVGFCLITSNKNLKKIEKLFPKKYQPYEIGFVQKNKNKINLINSLQW